MLEIDGLYYPQTVFDSLLNQTMEEILQAIIDRSKTPRQAVCRVLGLRNKALRERVYREAMRRTKASVPGLKADEIDPSFTLLPSKKPVKSA